MDKAVRERFPYEFTKPLAKELGVAWRTLLRRARKLGVDKEEGFLDKHRSEITDMAARGLRTMSPEAKERMRPKQFSKGFIENQFKKGNVPAIVTDPEVRKKVSATRRKLMEEDRWLIAHQLPPKTKMIIRG